VNWDPANAFFEGDTPYPDGYEHVKGLVKHVHFKDALKNAQGEPEYALEGDIDWTGQVEALAVNGYPGFISIETHLRPKVAAAKSSLDRLRSLISRFGVK
jgi:sugar phosphate isomerase/epimerase